MDLADRSQHLSRPRCLHAVIGEADDRLIARAVAFHHQRIVLNPRSRRWLCPGAIAMTMHGDLANDQSAGELDLGEAKQGVLLERAPVQQAGNRHPRTLDEAERAFKLAV